MRTHLITLASLAAFAHARRDTSEAFHIEHDTSKPAEKPAECDCSKIKTSFFSKSKCMASERGRGGSTELTYMRRCEGHPCNGHTCDSIDPAFYTKMVGGKTTGPKKITCVYSSKPTGAPAPPGISEEVKMSCKVRLEDP
eukprot:TRINITY_DN36992_c0_g2_i1.p1 TRINITY_DN36992_c0_g2~~TRINITY_DN36992_c0_g2_i1.p1  ORF type:complete len:140 (+),score=7.74 TRINITY_DN36992_c0_g2_i1:68-487(+)